MTPLLLALAACTWVTQADWNARQDWDRDGYVDSVFGGDDCDDTDATIHPGAEEIWYDGIDQDCDLGSDYDADGDGFNATDYGGIDCDDAEATVYSGAEEACDGLDNNCDGELPANEIDVDRDGWMVCAGDCDDSDAAVSPEATEICDDHDRDEDCDGLADDDDDSTEGDSLWYADFDEDDWGSEDDVVVACEQPEDYVAERADIKTNEIVFDCDDSDDTVHPTAPELCDRLDNDCDGSPEEDEVTDEDGDGFVTCEDCDPLDDTVYPGAPEYCDGRKTDCDVALWQSDDGLLSFETSGGEWSVLEGGDEDTPAALTLDREGTLYVCDGTFFVQLSVAADVAVVGDTAAESVLHSGAAGPVLDVAAAGVSVSLTGVTLRGGYGAATSLPDGASYYAGGGLRCAIDAAVSLTDVGIQDNTAEFGAGALVVDGCTASFDRVSFSDNDASIYGGGLLAAEVDDLDLKDCSFAGNIANQAGGGALLLEADAEISGGTFSANSSAAGGGLAVSGGSVWLGQTSFIDGTALNGGAIYLEGAAASLEGGELSGNSAAGYGGGIYANAAAGAITLTEVTVSFNEGFTGGGGLYLEDLTALAITDSDFIDNAPEDLWRGGFSLPLASGTTLNCEAGFDCE